MKTYLEYKDEKSQKFWEISVSDTNIITRYGKLDTDGKEISKPFGSNAIAVYEMYKQILAKRKKSYALPNMVSMEALKKLPITNLTDIDKAHYSDLEGSYRTAFFIDGDLALDVLDLDAFEAGGLIVTGNLYVNGGMKNSCGGTGGFLIVKGDVIADFIVGGGSEIYLNGNSQIHTFGVGFYNDGILSINNINTICFINSDHHSEIDGNIQLNLDVFDEDDVKKLLEIFSKKEDFFECEDDAGEEYCYIGMDNFNEHIFDEKKRLNFLKKVITELL